jgi:hypothetical protein
MNTPDRDEMDADLLQRALLNKGQCSWLDRILNALMWTLAILMLVLVVVSPIVWGWL